MRDGSENGSSVNAPVSAVKCPGRGRRSPPRPRRLTLDPRHLTPPVGRRECRRGSRPRRASRRAGRRRAGAARVSPVFARQWTSRAGRWTQVPGAKRAPARRHVQLTLALEDVDHLVVGVEVVGRAARRDEADELGHRSAADLGVAPSTNWRPAVALPFSSAVRSSTACSPAAAAGRGRAPRPRGPSPSALQAVPRRGTPTSRAERVRLAADRRAARALEHVEHLVGARPSARAATRTTRCVKQAAVEEAPVAVVRLVHRVTASPSRLCRWQLGRDRQALLRRVRARRPGRRARRHGSRDRVAPGPGAAARRPLPRPRRGAANIFDPLDEEWWDDFTAVPDEFLDAGDEVVVIGRYRGVGKHTGKQLDVPFVHVWTMRGDKAVRFRQFLDTAGWVARSADLIIDTACRSEETRCSARHPPSARPRWAKEDI